MRPGRLIVASVLVIATSCGFLGRLLAGGPYLGKVIDAETKEPLVGAVLLVYWLSLAGPQWALFGLGESVTLCRSDCGRTARSREPGARCRLGGRSPTRPDRMMPTFDRFARDYERHLDHSVSISGEGAEYFAEYKARYLATLVPADFSGKILDFGCGAGLLARFVRQALPNARLHGYDESTEMVAEVNRRVDSGMFTTDRGQLDRDYDLIVVANVLHHVDPNQRPDVVGELRHRLRLTGRLVIFEHNPVNPLTRWAVSRCPFDKGVRLLPPAETRGYLRRAGLGPVQVDYIVFFPRAMRSCRRLEARLWWCPLGAQYVAVAMREE